MKRRDLMACIGTAATTYLIAAPAYSAAVVGQKAALFRFGWHTTIPACLKVWC